MGFIYVSVSEDRLSRMETKGGELMVNTSDQVCITIHRQNGKFASFCVCLRVRR